MYGQIKVFHAFLGLGEKKTGFPASTPGMYEVIWEGGVRYRTAPKYQSIAEKELLALPETQYEIEDFVTGEDGVCQSAVAALTGRRSNMATYPGPSTTCRCGCRTASLCLRRSAK